MTEVVASARQVLEAQGLHGRSVCVGLSGGLDSVVLLHVLVALREAFALRISAIHVDHGLHPNAGKWAGFCVRLCETVAVPLTVERVTVPRASGLGIEAAARAQRYAVFEKTPADFLLLAHHLDDQAETLLLQLLRGAGAPGLSAMPVERALGAGGPQLVRPFLTLQRAQLEAFALANALEWVDDDSNEELVYDRNYLRHTVLPLIEKRFPAYRSTLSRSGRNLADAAGLAAILGEQDLAALRVGDAIALDKARDWPAYRVLNVLRSLFRHLGQKAPRRALLLEAVRQAFEAGPQTQVRVDFGAWSLRRYRAHLYVVKNLCVPGNWSAQWRGEPKMTLPPGLGELRFEQSQGAGFSLSKLHGGMVNVTFRTGGERMALGPGRPHRNLRNLFQDAGVPSWLRERTPLLFYGERLLFVPGLGAAAEFQAGPDEASCHVEWASG